VDTPNMPYENKAFKIWGYQKTYPLIIIQYFSGILSEAFLCGKYDWHNAQNDMEQIEYIRKINFDCKSIDVLWKISEKMVIKNWGKIKIVADALIKNNFLIYHEVENILKTDIPKIRPPALQPIE